MNTLYQSLTIGQQNMDNKIQENEEKLQEKNKILMRMEPKKPINIVFIIAINFAHMTIFYPTRFKQIKGTLKLSTRTICIDDYLVNMRSIDKASLC